MRDFSKFDTTSNGKLQSEKFIETYLNGQSLRKGICPVLIGSSETMPRHLKHFKNRGIYPEQIVIIERELETYKSLENWAHSNGDVIKVHFGDFVEIVKNYINDVTQIDFDGVSSFDSKSGIKPLLEMSMTQNTPLIGSITGLYGNNELSEYQKKECERFGKERWLSTKSKDYTEIRGDKWTGVILPDGDGVTKKFILARKSRVGDVIHETNAPQKYFRNNDDSLVIYLELDGQYKCLKLDECVLYPDGRIEFKTPPIRGTKMYWEGKTLSRVRNPHYKWLDYISIQMNRYVNYFNTLEWDKFTYSGVGLQSHMITICTRYKQGI